MTEQAQAGADLPLTLGTAGSAAPKIVMAFEAAGVALVAEQKKTGALLILARRKGDHGD
jgi:hypothetical protein